MVMPPQDIVVIFQSARYGRRGNFFQALKKFSAVCDDWERASFSLVVATGFRRGELQTLHWLDLDLGHRHLHRFRDTAATRWLQAGIDVRTVRVCLGHESLATTQKDLEPSKETGAQLDRMSCRFRKDLPPSGGGACGACGVRIDKSRSGCIVLPLKPATAPRLVLSFFLDRKPDRFSRIRLRTG